MESGVGISFDWWNEVNRSLVWQDRIFHTLAGLFGFVAAVVLGPISSVSEEIAEIKKLLQNEIHLRKCAEAEVNNLKNQLAQWKRSEAPGNSEILELRKMLEDEAPIAKLFEQVGLQKILSLLESEDVDVRIHAVKVVANPAAEGSSSNENMSS